MKEVTIKIPETRLQFFLDLMKQLGFEVSQKYDIPEDHKSIVRDRIRKSNAHPELLEDWDIIKDKFNLDA